MKKKIIIIIGIILVILVTSTIAGIMVFKSSGSKQEECVPTTGGGYTLFFDTDGGEEIDSMHICIACSPDSYEDIPNPTKDNSTFQGWYYDQSYTKKVTEKSTADIKPIAKKDSNGCMTGYQDITLYAKWNDSTPKEDNSKKDNNSTTKTTKTNYYCADGSTPNNGTCTKTETIAATKSYRCDNGGTLNNNKCQTEMILPATGGACPTNSSYSVVEDSCIEITNDDADTCASKGGYMDFGGGSCRIDRGAPSQYACQGETAGWELINGNQCRNLVSEDATVIYSCPSGYNQNGSQCTKTTTTKALKK